MQRASKRSRRMSPLRIIALGLGLLLALLALWQLVAPQQAWEVLGQGLPEMLSVPTSSRHQRSCQAEVCVEVDLTKVLQGSPFQYGTFLEDINHAVEGGLLVEMMRDWSFEARAYLDKHAELAESSVTDEKPKPWPEAAPKLVKGSSKLQAASMDPAGVAALPLLDHKAWQLSGSGVRESFMVTDAAIGLNALCVQSTSVTQTWLTNRGHSLEGFAVEARMAYRLRIRIKGDSDLTLQAILGSDDGAVSYADAALPLSKGSKVEGMANWLELDTTLIMNNQNIKKTYLHITWRGPRKLCLDWVSLTPQTSWSAAGAGNVLNPFHPRLVAAMAGLEPQFLRFPGGAFVEGASLASSYRWKTTVGPRELRPGHPNTNWGYWSSDGIGLFEFLQLSEQLGAEPVWVVPVGISQTESAAPEKLDEWITDALDSLQFILGPSTSKWGQVRASMGRTPPWALRFVTLGNEECNRPWYAQHYARFAAALLAAQPEISLISNCDLGDDQPAASWEFHTYKDPVTTFGLRKAVHEYQGKKPVAVTEFAALGSDVAMNAIAEAGLMAALERNCSKVHMVSYAPLMGHEGLMTWGTTLLTFNDTRHWTASPSYRVQQLFREHWRGNCAEVEVHSPTAIASANSMVEVSATCAGGASCTQVTVKLVNFSPDLTKAQLVLVPPKHGKIGIGGRHDVQRHVDAQLLTLDVKSLMPQKVSERKAALGEEDEEGDLLLTGSSGASSADTAHGRVQLSLQGKPAFLELPPYSLTILTAKLK